MYNGNGQPAAPIYPFGFGLSYTRFEISAPVLDRPAIRRDGETTVRVAVRNVGAREGDEVVQMYITDDYASLARPARELRGFRRVTLKPGETTEVAFRISGEELRFWKDDGWVVEPGTFQVWVGNCCTCTSRVQLTVEE
jgi:beta-glucosidase